MPGPRSHRELDFFVCCAHRADGEDDGDADPDHPGEEDPTLDSHLTPFIVESDNGTAIRGIKCI